MKCKRPRCRKEANPNQDFCSKACRIKLMSTSKLLLNKGCFICGGLGSSLYNQKSLCSECFGKVTKLIKVPSSLRQLIAFQDISDFADGKKETL